MKIKNNWLDKKILTDSNIWGISETNESICLDKKGKNRNIER